MEYSPHWFKTLILATFLNLLALEGSSAVWMPTEKIDEEKEPEVVEWVDVPSEESPAVIEEVASVTVPKTPAENFEFQPLVMPPIEIPQYVPEPLPKIEPLPEVEPEIKSEVPPETPPIEEKIDTDKTAETDENVEVEETARKTIRVIAKVYPKDVIDELLKEGAIKEVQKLHGGKVIVQVLIGTDGKVKKTEIKRGGGYDERGNIINTIIEVAASRWIFEPYLDEENKVREMPTQIEFSPADF